MGNDQSERLQQSLYTLYTLLYTIEILKIFVVKPLMSFENFDAISTLYKKGDRRKLMSTFQMFKKRDQYSAVKTKQAL